MEPALEQLAGQGDMPTYDEAKVHLHNLAHMFMSPLILLASLEMVEEKTAAYGELVDKADALQRRHDQLIKDCQDLEDMQKTLQTAVMALERRRDTLQTEIGRLVNEFVTQAQRVPVQEEQPQPEDN